MSLKSKTNLNFDLFFVGINIYSTFDAFYNCPDRWSDLF